MAAPRSQASDSVTLLLSLVPYLLTASPVSVREAAQNFGVTEQTMRDTVTGLTTLGVPDKSGDVYGDHMFDIDWFLFEEQDEIYLTHAVGIEGTPRFSAREAATLTAGLTLIKSTVDESDAAAVQTLIQKIARGTSSRPAGITLAAAQAPASLELVREAIAKGMHVAFDYRSTGGQLQHRLVDPIVVEAILGAWYLRGYCHLREAVRTFRADRLVNLTIDPRPIDTVVTAADLDELQFTPSDNDMIATLRLARWALPAIIDFGPREISGTTEELTVEVNFASVESVFRALSRRPGVITVIAPDSLRKQVADWASNAL
jgi:proteasome accessory factor C